jgi:hypothetical protein
MQGPASNLGIPLLGLSVIGRTQFTRLWDAETSTPLPTEEALLNVLVGRSGQTSVRVTVRRLPASPTASLTMPRSPRAAPAHARPDEARRQHHSATASRPMDAAL